MKDEQLDKLQKLLCEATIYAHKDKLTVEDEMEYLPSEHKRIGSVSFQPESMLKYAGMTVTKSGGTYWLKFKAIGRLKEILLTANLPTDFTSLLLNTKFKDSMLLTKDDDITSFFYQSHFTKKIDTASISNEAADIAIRDIEKLFFLKKITYA